MRELAFLNKEITIKLIDERAFEDDHYKSEEFFSSNGLEDFINYLDETREKLIDKPIHMEGEKNATPIEIAMRLQYIIL
jgi:DNA gyrase subunit B